MKHKHAELIHAWAEGAQIETKSIDGSWNSISSPSWGEAFQYRIKRTPRFRVLYIDERYSTPQASVYYYESLEEFGRRAGNSHYKPLQLLESQREVL